MGKVEQVKDDVVGKAKETVGKLTDDHKLEAEGKLDQAKVDVQRLGDKVADKLS